MNDLQKTITISFFLFVISIALLIISFEKVTVLFSVCLSFVSGYFLHSHEVLRDQQSGDQ